jgi:hypothetical protein
VCFVIGRNLRADPAAFQFATSALSVGGNPTLIRKEVLQNWGHYMKNKDIYNLKQAMTGI